MKKKIWPFSKVKPFDILVLLLIIGGAAFFFLGSQKGNTADGPEVSAPRESETIVLTCRRQSAFPWEYEELSEKDYPQIFIESGLGEIAGAYITGVSKEVHVESNPDADGKLVSSNGKFVCDLVFTVEAVVPAGSPNLSIGSQEVRAGRGLFIRAKDIDIPTNIEKIEFK